MRRALFKEKKTCEELLLWIDYENGRLNLYKDLCMSELLDVKKYEECDFNKVYKKRLPKPFDIFGIECGRGWYGLIQPLVDYIDSYNTENEGIDRICIEEIKEKYGCLCIHVNHATEELSKMIHDAEVASESVCEVCGSRERIGSTVKWDKILCHECMVKKVRKRWHREKWHNYDDGKVYWVYPDKSDELIEQSSEYEEKNA